MGASSEPETHVWIPVKPIAKQRPITRKNGQTFTPARTVQFEREVAEWYRSSGLLHRYETPVEVTITLDTTGFGLDIKPTDCDRAGLRGDVDNYAKAINDALNDVAWRDDKLVVVLHIEKKLKGRPS